MPGASTEAGVGTPRGCMLDPLGVVTNLCYITFQDIEYKLAMLNFNQTIKRAQREPSRTASD